MVVLTQRFKASSRPLPRIKEIASDTPPPDAATLSRYLGVIDGEIRTLCLDYDKEEVEGYIGDSGIYTPPLDPYAPGQDVDKGGRGPCECEMYGYCLCMISAGVIQRSCLTRPCEDGCMDGCPCQTCAGRKFVRLSLHEHGEIWVFEESVLAWEDDDGDVRIRRATASELVKLKVALPIPRMVYRSMEADSYHCGRCGANIAPFSRFDELVYVGADTHGSPLFYDCTNCGLESGGHISGMEPFTDDANTPPLATWDGVRTSHPRVEKSKAKVWEKKNERQYLPNWAYSHIGRSSNSPTAFISYSHDSEEHVNWVRGYLADRLRSDGVEVKIDEDMRLGDDIPRFMESLTDQDFVLAICTPKYKERYDNRLRGVGYEGRLMADAIIKGSAKGRVIPVLRDGSFDEESLPKSLVGLLGVDLSENNPRLEEEYMNLLGNLCAADSAATYKRNR